MCDLNKISTLNKLNHKNTSFNSYIFSSMFFFLFCVSVVLESDPHETQERNEITKKSENLRIIDENDMCLYIHTRVRLHIAIPSNLLIN